MPAASRQAQMIGKGKDFSRAFLPSKFGSFSASADPSPLALNLRSVPARKNVHD
jgi:hypothetical protein